jgi:hypothetical protein
MVDAIVPYGAKTYSAKAHAAIRIDIAEHERRAHCGLGALERAAINSMFSLPYGHWIRWEDLEPPVDKYLRRLPDGIVEHSDYGVRRLVVPPLTVELAVVTGLSWSKGLSAAATFAGYCSRVLLLGQCHRIPKSKLWEADYYGIGVWTNRADGIEELVAPAPWKQLYSKPVGWEFRERAYDAWLRATGQRPLGGPSDLFGTGIMRESSGTIPDGLEGLIKRLKGIR